MGYIGAHGVAALRKHKYSGVDHSIVSKYVLQPFWTRCVNLFPLWMPPNMITLTGSMFLVTSALLGYIYSPQLDSPPPRWVNFAHGLLLFLYQTFDAVDGKQARRTNSSSPLGELFDHGCDALGCAFEALAFGSTAMCGRNTFWFWVISAVPFYCATWENYFTNTLILPIINGPTEGLLLIYSVHFFTAIVGTEWWAQPFGKSIPFSSWVPIVNEMPMYNAALFMMIVFAVIPTVLFNVYNVYKIVRAKKGSMLLALAMLYPFALLLGGVLFWDYLSPLDLLGNYPHLVILGIGLSFGFLVGRMILAHICDEPKGLKTSMCMSLLYLPFAIANALTASLNDGVPLVDEFWVLLGFFAYSVVLYMHFVTSIVHEITTALGIYCFRITRKEA
ncbi:choline/ethanolaminephosphotransferase 1 [Salvia hispanica]|uniref:choline/ethanolaminephosphotransferase 1 n=1 Tax=Salvia hispanica TaxID=49212 RepID=UPI0020095869|nr:choline/ethanolaminephosphotransferase 1 [Salvia hispanica]XP_047960440.1 choline/ethanolaminephosphotransferase 1 [Salvia hispanica]XP_047960441.1 choline/ethanolaminephosphotransferase 1 [Salvia hispanica]